MDIAVPKNAKERIYGYYLRDDDELMIEMRPGEFVSETAARCGLTPPSMLAEIQRIKARLRRPPRRLLRNPKHPFRLSVVKAT